MCVCVIWLSLNNDQIKQQQTLTGPLINRGGDVHVRIQVHTVMSRPPFESCNSEGFSLSRVLCIDQPCILWCMSHPCASHCCSAANRDWSADWLCILSITSYALSLLDKHRPGDYVSIWKSQKLIVNHRQQKQPHSCTFVRGEAMNASGTSLPPK